MAFEAILKLAHDHVSAFPTVTVVSAAVSDKAGYTPFHATPQSGLSGIKLMANDIGSESKIITVPTVSLDDVIGDAHIDMIKIGGEYPLFLRAKSFAVR